MTPPREGESREPVAGVGAVRFRDVSFAFGASQVLHDIDLAIGPGITGVLGLNGVGKTTALRVMATVLQPTRGEIELLGLPMSSTAAIRAARRRIGYVPQDARWNPALTVRDFVSYFAWLRRVPRRNRVAAVGEAMERTNVDALASKRLRELSGGEHQRVMLAQALVHAPRLLILDEPTSGLDPLQRSTFRAVLRALDEDVSVVLSTHLLEDVADVAGSVVVVKTGGRVVFQDSPAALAARAWDRTATTNAMEQGFLRVIHEDSP